MARVLLKLPTLLWPCSVRRWTYYSGLRTLIANHGVRRNPRKYSGFARTRPMSTDQDRTTIDEDEVRHFNELARSMWSEQGEYELLHLMNHLRVPFIVDGMKDDSSSGPRGPEPLKGKRILDVGCGGGLLSEPLARLGARVLGVDASDEGIEVARLHSKTDPSMESRLEYLCKDITDIHDCKYDAVVASEVIEHVSNVDTFLDGCCRLVKPGGSIFLTTINRTQLSYLLTIALAEKVFRLVPSGIHDWNKYVDPDELKRKLSERGMAMVELRGMLYNPVSKRWSWQADVSVNYALQAVKMGMDFPDDEQE